MFIHEKSLDRKKLYFNIYQIYTGLVYPRSGNPSFICPFESQGFEDMKIRAFRRRQSVDLFSFYRRRRANRPVKDILEKG